MLSHPGTQKPLKPWVKWTQLLLKLAAVSGFISVLLAMQIYIIKSYMIVEISIKISKECLEGQAIYACLEVPAGNV